MKEIASRRRWMGLAAPALVGLVVALAPHDGALAQQGGGSQNCPYKTGRLTLPKGTFDGSLSASLVAVGGQKQLNQTWTLSLSGKMQLVAEVPTGIEHGYVDLEYRFFGSGEPAAHTVAGLNFSGKGHLDQVRATADNTFSAWGKLQGGGTVFALTPSANAGHSGAASDNVELKFTITDSLCEYAGGTFTSALIDGTASSLQGKGFTIAPGSATWHVGASTDLAQRISKLKQELEKAPPSGIVARRDAEGRRLGKIADDIKKEKNTIARDCLLQVWFHKVEDFLEKQMVADTAKLVAYSAQGDLAGLRDLISNVLADDRQLAIAGVDTCIPGLHEKAFEAIQDKLGEYLGYLVEHAAPVRDILSVLRSVMMMGVISPRLEHAVEVEIERQAAALVHMYRKRVVELLKKCDPDLRRTWQSAAAAERQARIIGAPNADTVMDLVPAVQACP